MKRLVVVMAVLQEELVVPSLNGLVARWEKRFVEHFLGL